MIERRPLRELTPLRIDYRSGGPCIVNQRPGPPLHPKLYYITHLQDLAGMVGAEPLSEAERLRQDLPCTFVGMNKIKRRRLEEVLVPSCGNRFGAQFVPFYFCPRPIMLFLLDRGNKENLDCAGGQSPLLQLLAELNAVIQLASQRHPTPAISGGNADSNYISYFADLNKINQLNWGPIAANDWNDPMIKEAKQSESFLPDSFPWTLVESIGVISDARRNSVLQAIAHVTHQPPVYAKPEWYY